MHRSKSKNHQKTVSDLCDCNINLTLLVGGLSYSGNAAGAEYGTGYCDAQCPHDIKFISGEANCEGWIFSETDPNSGTGKWGSCCAEMDLWEANGRSQAFTTHPCSNIQGKFISKTGIS